MSSSFKREDRYTVIKNNDAMDALTGAEHRALFRICTKVIKHRAAIGKEPLQTVVVEKDWPEYEPTWLAIEQRMQVPS